MRTAIEHPGKTLALAHLADIGNQRAEELLGPLGMPSYLKERGVFPVSVDDGIAEMVDPSALSTWGTATNSARLVHSLIQAGEQGGRLHFREAASPALNALVGVLTGTNSGGREYSTGSLVGAIEELWKGTPAWTYLREAGIVDRPDTTKPAYQQPIYQPRGALGVLERATLGGVYPRPASLEVSHAKAEREYRLGLGPVKRFQYDSRNFLSTLDREGRRLGVFDSMPATMRDIVSRYIERRTGYAREAEKRGIPASRLGVPDRFRIDLEIARRRDIIDAETYRTITRAIPQMRPEELESVRRSLIDAGFGQGGVSDYMSYLRSRGVEIEWPP